MNTKALIERIAQSYSIFHDWNADSIYLDLPDGRCVYATPNYEGIPNYLPIDVLDADGEPLLAHSFDVHWTGDPSIDVRLWSHLVHVAIAITDTIRKI